MTAPGERVVLVVDDDADHGFMLQALLEADGFEVLVATSCARGRALLRERKIDVLLTDLSLGDGSALDVIKGLDPARRPRVSIVISGFDAPADVDRTRAAGFDAHFGKPASLDRLRRTIADALR
ncbi:MAG: response regulator receiver protein [Labilithrix sp.]|nr:response regulator receiver protein [Labilithrix sp.]